MGCSHLWVSKMTGLSAAALCHRRSLASSVLKPAQPNAAVGRFLNFNTCQSIGGSRPSLIVPLQGLPVGGLPGARLHRAAPARRQHAGLAWPDAECQQVPENESRMKLSLVVRLQGLPVGGLPGARLHRAAPARRQRADLPRAQRPADPHPRLLLPRPLHRPALCVHRLRRRHAPHLWCAPHASPSTPARSLQSSSIMPPQ